MPQKSGAKINAKPGAKPGAKASAELSAKVVVFGVCEDNWPRAGWFPQSQADAARAAAKQLRLNV